MDGIKLFIFDVGGVLRDSSRALHEGFRRGFASAGLTCPFTTEELWRLRGIGKYNNSRHCIRGLLAVLRAKENLSVLVKQMNAEERLDQLVEAHFSSADNQMVDQIRVAYKQYFNSAEVRKFVQLYPRVSEALDLLERRGYQLAVMSNASRVSLERDLQDIGLERFDMIVSEDEVTQKKPSGEGIRTIMAALKERPAKTVYVGDTVVDIRAARDAGCRSAAVLCGMGQQIHLERERPDYVFPNIYEMAKYFTS